MDELEGNQLEAALLEPGDDVADEPALDAVRLEENGTVVSSCMGAVRGGGCRP